MLSCACTHVNINVGKHPKQGITPYNFVMRQKIFAFFKKALDKQQKL